MSNNIKDATDIATRNATSIATLNTTDNATFDDTLNVIESVPIDATYSDTSIPTKNAIDRELKNIS